MFEIARTSRPSNMLKTLGRLGQEFNDWEKIMDNLFHFHGFPTLSGLDVPSFSPSLDFIDKTNEYEANIELPGLTEKDIEISINDDDTLIIKGEKKKEREEEKEDFYVCERSYGAFRREITLPKNVNKDNISATFENGILKLCLPKNKELNEKKTKKIEVKTKK